MNCGGVLGFCMLVMSVCIVVRSSASLTTLGMCLCVVRNSSGVIMALVSLFCICCSVVIPCVYSLSRYCWNFIFALSIRLA